MDTALELTGVAADCPAGDISEAIAEIFPTKKNLAHKATITCGQIFKDFGKGKQAHAIQRAFQFFEKTLQQYEADQLLDPDPSVEAKIVDLFAAIFAGLAVGFPDIDPDDLAEIVAEGEYAIGTLRPGGPPLITPSGHAGIGDPGDGLFGPVTAFVFLIGPDEGESELSVSSESHPCPAGVDNSFDCYPLFFDYSVFPESNVNPAVGLQLGQCNVSPGGVEVLLLSPEGFLPEDDAPNGVVCDDVQPEEEIAMTGWRSVAWAVLEPISPLFRVTPAIAGKNPIGGRISAFSPVAPADPESGGEVTLGSISGQVFDSSNDNAAIQGATVELFTNDEELVGTTETNSDGNYSFTELELGGYIVQAEAEGYSGASSEPVTLTEENPDAEGVNIGLEPTAEPEPLETQTELTPDNAVMSTTESSEGTQLFTATVTEVESGDPVPSDGVVVFEVTNSDNVAESFMTATDALGQAFLEVGCATESFGDIQVPSGSYDVFAHYLGVGGVFTESQAITSVLSCNLD
ncbi:MAG: carboxypeptidase-like regulatory domain-containing protein [Gemmatimonadota bacterium]